MRKCPSQKLDKKPSTKVYQKDLYKNGVSMQKIRGVRMRQVQFFLAERLNHTGEKQEQGYANFRLGGETAREKLLRGETLSFSDTLDIFCILYHAEYIL